MFHVIIPQMQSGCDQLGRRFRELSCVEDSLSGVISVLSAMSGMESAAAQLKKARGDIQQEQEVCRQMRQALDGTLQNYANCEGRILSAPVQGHAYGKR